MLNSVTIDNSEWLSPPPPAVWLRRKNEDFVFLLLLKKLIKLTIIADITARNYKQDGQSTGGHCPVADLCGGALLFRPVWIRNHIQFQVSEKGGISTGKLLTPTNLDFPQHGQHAILQSGQGKNG